MKANKLKLKANKIKKNVKTITKAKDRTNKNGSKQKVMIVAQELKFARLLAGNDKKSRDRVLKALKKWLNNCFEKDFEFKEENFVRIWKGLFYAVWMSDKPLVQEELCENISSVLDLFPASHFASAMLMVKAAFTVLATEWYGIDQHRIDKFLMFVRRFLRASLRCLDRGDWSPELCEMYADMLGTGILNPSPPHYARNAHSLVMHICDCFLEELAKVSKGSLPPESLVTLLTPFMKLVAVESSTGGAARRLFIDLIKQSDQGLEYEEKRRAWIKMGCPKGGPDALELASDDDEEDEDDGGDENEDEKESEDDEECLDPRAGHKDSWIPSLPLPNELLPALRHVTAAASGAGRTRLASLVTLLEKSLNEEYPLKLEDVEVESSRPRVGKSAQNLRNFEKKLVVESDELALKGLSKRQRKRLLAKTREGHSIMDEVTAMAQENTSNNSGVWHVEEVTEDNMKTDKKTAKKRNKKQEMTDLPKKQKLEKTQPNEPKVEKNESKKPTLEKTQSKTPKIENLVARKPKLEKSVTEKPKLEKSVTEKPKLEKSVTKKPKLEKSTKNKMEKPTSNKKLDKSKPIDKKKNNINSKKVNEKPDTKITEKPQKDVKEVKITTNSEPKKPIDNDKTKQNMSKPTIQKNKKIDSDSNKTVLKHEKKNKALLNLTPKRVKFILKNNSAQSPFDYFKNVKQNPKIPFDGEKKPLKTNLKVGTPSPINPFIKRKLKIK